MYKNIDNSTIHDTQKLELNKCQDEWNKKLDHEIFISHLLGF